MERLVVVGASLAGLRAAHAARSAGFAGELVVVGDEPHMPYTRPPLSKQYLAGEHGVEDCAFKVADNVQADWRLGVAATALDRDAKQVQLADGRAVPYDRVVIATGCRARTWPGEPEGVITLRGLDDAIALRAAFDARPRLVIVGAGFVGCEVAATARKAGLDVTVVDIAQQPMVPLGPELGARCADIHRDHGVTFHLGAGVTEVRRDEVVLATGERLPADLVVVALGALPNTEWLAGSGLDVERGLACDETLTAIGDPDVLGAGDVVSWPHPLADGERVRIEHWTVAAEHGMVAGRNAVLEPEERKPHDTPPYFWSDQYDVKIQAVGFPARADRLEVIESNAEGDRFVAAGARDGRLVGVVAFNAAKRLAFYRRQLAAAPAFDDVRAEAVAL